MLHFSFNGANFVEDNLLGLPPDLWIKIISRYFYIQDVLTLSGVCVFFSNLIRKTPDFWVQRRNRWCKR